MVHLYGDAWPSDFPPTIKAITLSVKRLLARRDKLIKLRNPSEKDQKVLEFMNEMYVLPVILQANGKVHKHSDISDSVSSEGTCVSSHDSSSELENLKFVNEDLGQKLMRLEVENESLKKNDSIEVLQKKVYSFHHNTKKAWLTGQSNI